MAKYLVKDVKDLKENQRPVAVKFIRKDHLKAFQREIKSRAETMTTPDEGCVVGLRGWHTNEESLWSESDPSGLSLEGEAAAESAIDRANKWPTVSTPRTFLPF